MNRPAAAPDLTLLELRGTAREIGRQHGEHWREAIAEVCEARLGLTLRWAREKHRLVDRPSLLTAMAPCLERQAAETPYAHDEFLGIAEGAGLTPAELLVGNGYTDIKDWACAGLPDAGECTTFTALGEATADGAVYCGQTWDMDASMLPHVFALRRIPVDGPATLGITTCGCLSLIGLNDAGLAVGNSNLRPTDPRPGVQYLALIHEALSRRSLDDAAEVFRRATRLSGHHYYLADAMRALHLEATATRVTEPPRDGAVHVHSNDYRTPGCAALAEPIDPVGRSIERRCALSEALGRRPLDLPALRAGLEDSRVAVRELVLASKTCAAVILKPAGGELWATHGPPEPAHWHAWRL